MGHQNNTNQYEPVHELQTGSNVELIASTSAPIDMRGIGSDRECNRATNYAATRLHLVQTLGRATSPNYLKAQSRKRG